MKERQWKETNNAGKCQKKKYAQVNYMKATEYGEIKKEVRNQQRDSNKYRE